MNTHKETSEQLTRRELDWILAWGMMLTGQWTHHQVIVNTMLPVARMHRCRSCGREYYDICLNCTYRHGGDLAETEDEPVYDLVTYLRSRNRM